MDVMKFNLGQKFNLEKRPNYSSYILFTRANKDCFYAHQKTKKPKRKFRLFICTEDGTWTRTA